MSIVLVVTAGFGNGTFSGSVKDVVTRGYTIGVEVTLQGREMVAGYVVRTMSAEAQNRDMITDALIRKMYV
jgi:hypothetical protein